MQNTLSPSVIVLIDKINCLCVKVCYGFSAARQRDLIIGALLAFSFLITSTCIYIALGVEEHADQAKLS